MSHAASPENTQRRYLVDSALFLAVESLNRGLPLLILPFITRVFESKEVGIYSSILLGASYLYILVNASTHASINIQVGKSQGEPELQKKRIRGVLHILIAFSIMGIVLVALAGGVVSLVMSKAIFPYAFLVAISGATQSLYVSAGAFFRSTGRRRSYFFMNLLNLAVFLSSAAVLVFVFKAGIWALVVATSLGAATSVVFLSLTLELLRFERIPLSLVREVLTIGLPIVVTDLFNLTYTNVTRIIILAKFGPTMLAPYHVAFTLASIVSIIVQSFNMAYVPVFLAAHYRRPGAIRATDPITWPIVAVTIISSTMIISAPYFGPLFFPGSYAQFVDYLVFPLTGFALLPVYFALTNVLSVDASMVRKKMYAMMFSATSTLALAAILTILLGIYGALLAAPIGSLLGILASYFVVKRHSHYKIPITIPVFFVLGTMAASDLIRRFIASQVAQSYRELSSVCAICCAIALAALFSRLRRRGEYTGEAFAQR